MKNPSWQRDELILALDVYFRENYNKLSANHRTTLQLWLTMQQRYDLWQAEQRNAHVVEPFPAALAKI